MGFVSIDERLCIEKTREGRLAALREVREMVERECESHEMSGGLAAQKSRYPRQILFKIDAMIKREEER